MKGDAKLLDLRPTLTAMEIMQERGDWKLYSGPSGKLKKTQTWPASKYLARHDVIQKIKKIKQEQARAIAWKSSRKRSLDEVVDPRPRPRRKTKAKPPPLSKKQKELDAKAYVFEIDSVELPYKVPVYEDCDVVGRKINKFLTESGMTQGFFLKAINSQANSRIEQEVRWGPNGYKLKHDNGMRRVLPLQPCEMGYGFPGANNVDPTIFNIDAMRDRRMGFNNAAEAVAAVA
ncbi:hypothetical protein TrLO_g14528 [Triparma laevis f. longispina]|uniref:DUF7726 domain-containing protein n=1 Tax=Triparma laevis f. longispina TaxID=1714387 RepID=A0A9W7ASU1_9STRA|nr:hypothetical protein TrLO_g14528 [Triparma laevis f. longispina]